LLAYKPIRIDCNSSRFLRKAIRHKYTLILGPSTGLLLNRYLNDLHSIVEFISDGKHAVLIVSNAGW